MNLPSDRHSEAMLDFSQELETAPNAFVSALPAGAAVDFVLSELTNIGESNQPHMASPACLDAWERTDYALKDALHTCANPETLLAAFERYDDDQLMGTVLTNPATPRTTEVAEATAGFEAAVLLQAFCEHYAGPRRAAFDPAVHADLRAALVAAHTPTEIATSISAALSMTAHMGEYQIPFDSFFPTGVADVVDNEVSLELYRHHRLIAGRKAEGTLEIRPATTLGPSSAELPELLGRPAQSLTPTEADRLRELIIGQEDPQDWNLLPALSARLGHHVLRLSDFDEVDWLRDLDLPYIAGEPTPGLTPRWVQDWLDNGLLAGPSNAVDELPWDLLRAAGEKAWDRLGDNASAWALLLAFLNEGWDGTYDELLETIIATA